MVFSITQNSHPPSGIKIIIVGAGFAGLTAAIEGHRKGHTPIILESFKELKVLGDIISFSANTGKFFERWPGVKEMLDPIVFNSAGLEYRDYNGNYLFFQETDKLFGRSYNGHRGEIHEIIFNYALSLGIDIRLGQEVTEYFETDTEAGVVTNGERLIGDVVLAADGVRSKGRKLVLGYEDKPKSSGYAVYRAWYNTEDIAANPRTRFLIENGDKHVVWLGPDIHFIVATLKGGKDISWVYTHKVRRGCLNGATLCSRIPSYRIANPSIYPGRSRCRRRLEHSRYSRRCAFVAGRLGSHRSRYCPRHAVSGRLEARLP
jgi:2-polyprenyl-6-methoxyphenol hydroxylase-like FAD-dependent oxidoreductase